MGRERVGITNENYRKKDFQSTPNATRLISLPLFKSQLSPVLNYSETFPCRGGEKKPVKAKKRITEYSSDTELNGPFPKKRKKPKNKS